MALRVLEAPTISMPVGRIRNSSAKIRKGATPSHDSSGARAALGGLAVREEGVGMDSEDADIGVSLGERAASGGPEMKLGAAFYFTLLPTTLSHCLVMPAL